MGASDGAVTAAIDMQQALREFNENGPTDRLFAWGSACTPAR